jgi:membrane-associated protease RseP (regulator of RpoE activity)
VDAGPIPAPAASPGSRDRLWLHALLFLLTLFTSTALGVRLAQSFRSDLPSVDVEQDWIIFLEILRSPAILLDGLAYSLTLLAILLAHEMGHFLACRYYGIRASLPYFLPAPTFIGTLGAFIRFRSPVKSRRELFDVGIAGPLAGFVALIPALGLGLAFSRVVPGFAEQGDVRFGLPWLLRLASGWVFPGADPADISLHPVARAAWVGLFATALNLMPVGQLDGGHLVYSALGEKHRWVATAFILALLPLGFVYWPWWFWAPVFFLFGRRHFAVFDNEPLGAGRRFLLLAALVLFALCFIPAPVLYNDGQGLLP